MKDLLTIILLILSHCVWGQTKKNITLSFDRKDFQTHEYQDKIYITSDTYDIYCVEHVREPALPHISVNVLIGLDEEFDSIAFSSNQILMRNNVDIVPNPTIVPNHFPVTFTNDKIAYSQKVYPQNNIEYLGERFIKGCKVLSFSICPMQYMPESQDLFLLERLSIDVHLKKVSTKILKEKFSRDESDKLEIKKIVANGYEYDTLYDTSSYRSSNGEIDYLIITSDSLKEAFQPLAQWKNQKGTKTTIMTVEEIYSYFNASDRKQLKIKKMIAEYFFHYHTKYVLLGGDTAIVPTQMCALYYNPKILNPNSQQQPFHSDSPVDLFYACMAEMDWDVDNDGIYGEYEDNISLTPDLAITRLPVSSIENTHQIVNRIINYEKCTDVSKIHKNILMCGSEVATSITQGDSIVSDAQYKGQQTYNQYISSYWNGLLFRFYDTFTDHASSSQYDFTAQNLQYELSKGYTFVYNDTHGTTTAWTMELGEGYKVPYAMELSNPSYSIILTTACLTNAFDKETCLSEALIRNPQSGILAYLGCSRFGWTTNTIIHPGPSNEFNRLFFQKLFADSIYNYGELIRQMKVEFSTRNMSYAYVYRWLQMGMNPLGDPEMTLFISQPVKFSNISINETSNGIVVQTGIDNCKVCAMSLDDNGEYLYEVVNSTNQYILNNPSASHVYSICITREGYIPYVILINTPYIQNEKLSGMIVYYQNEMQIGSDITTLKPQGPVIVQDGHIEIQKKNGVIIKNNFNTELGSTLEIK